MNGQAFCCDSPMTGALFALCHETRVFEAGDDVRMAEPHRPFSNLEIWDDFVPHPIVDACRGATEQFGDFLLGEEFARLVGDGWRLSRPVFSGML